MYKSETKMLTQKARLSLLTSLMGCVRPHTTY